MQPMQNEQFNSCEQQHEIMHKNQNPMENDITIHKPAKGFWHGWFRRERQQYRRPRILSWWNLFAVIGVITVIVQLIRYVIIPLLVYVNVLTGGAL